MSLGLCCQYIELDKNGKQVNLCNEKTIRYGAFKDGKYTVDQVKAVWYNNLTNIYSILQRIHKEGIKVFRFSSNLFPLFDVLENELLTDTKVKSLLQTIGKFILDSKLRVGSHPDQYILLSSNNPNVIENSIKTLKHHAWVFDEMNLPQTPFYFINIHGGVRGNSKLLVESTNKLPPNVKNRLTFENDERSYNIDELYKVYEQTNVPIVFDSHHYKFNTGNLSMDEALLKAISTWGNIKPLTHLSNTKSEYMEKGSFTQRRKHSDLINYVPDLQFQLNNENKIDIEVEAKLKNIAIQYMVERLGAKL